MKRFLSALLLGLLLLRPLSAAAWGGDVHRLINRSAVQCLPPDFHGFTQWAGQLEQLSTAADERKFYDSSESPRHYIDIDDYPEFFAGTLPHDYSAMVARYGASRVIDNGILPWAIRDSYGNLVSAFQAKDWGRAVQLAADLGHYIGDLHNPLHVTLNYNGQLTGQRGIHSRYESEMTDRYMAFLTPSPPTATRVTDVLNTTFGWIDEVYPGVKVILDADKAARSEAGGSTESTVYYQALWSETGQHTHFWIQSASHRIACVWYSAWIEAGAPLLPGTSPVQHVTVGRLKTMFVGAGR